MAKRNKADRPAESLSDNRKWRDTYPAPSSGPVFVVNWNMLIEQIATRDNFTRANLKHLEILCDLYQNYRNLSDSIDMLGHTYEVGGGRNGNQIKIRPEVSQLNQVRRDIKTYSQLLGLNLNKDKYPTAGEGDGASEWD